MSRWCGVVQVDRIGVERRQRADEPVSTAIGCASRRKPRRKNCICSLTIVCVRHAVRRSRAFCVGVRQLAVEQQVADLEEVAVHRELLDRVAAVQQLALVAVDVGDRRVARRGRQEARVVGELAGLAVQRPDVDDVGPDRAGEDREADGRRAVGEGQGGGAVGHWYAPPVVSAPVGRTRWPRSWRDRCIVGSASRSVVHGPSRSAQRCSSGATSASAGSRAPGDQVPQVVVGEVEQPVERRHVRRRSSRVPRASRNRVRIEVVLQHAAPAAPAQRD